MKTFREPSNLWSLLTWITTVALAAVAYMQLSDLAQTSKSDFLYKLKKDFFTEEARRLVFLIENELLEFRSADIPYFQIARPGDAETQSRLGEIGITGSSVSTYLVDDVLLGPLEDVGLLLRNNLVSLNDAYEQFESYVQICAEDRAISEYLRLARDGEGNEDVYDGFQYLYKRLEEAVLPLGTRSGVCNGVERHAWHSPMRRGML